MKFYKIANPNDPEIYINLEMCTLMLKTKTCTNQPTITFEIYKDGGAVQIFNTTKDRDDAFQEILDGYYS